MVVRGDFLMAMPKLICNIDPGLLEEVDGFAASLHITRTAAVSVLLSRALQTEKFTADFHTLMEAQQAKLQQG